jgi:hypothetical protein
VWGGANIKWLAPNIGYKGLRLDINYNGARPARGAFMQANTVTTIVVTVDNGVLKLNSQTPTYIEDTKDVKAGGAFKDNLGGPNFDRALRANAVFVFSYVVKQQGFTNDKAEPIFNGQKNVSKEDLEKFINRMNAVNYDNGSITYCYLWMDCTKAVAAGIKNPGDGIIATLGDNNSIVNKYLKAINAAKKFDINDFKGQLLFSQSGADSAGNAGLNLRVDLHGEDLGN